MPSAFPSTGADNATQVTGLQEAQTLLFRVIFIRPGQDSLFSPKVGRSGTPVPDGIIVLLVGGSCGAGAGSE